MTHQHYDGCYLHHFACAQERIRDLERELARRTAPTFAGYRPPVFVNEPVIATHSVCIPCGDPYFAHHGDEPPSATP